MTDLNVATDGLIASTLPNVFVKSVILQPALNVDTPNSLMFTAELSLQIPTKLKADPNFRVYAALVTNPQRLIELKQRDELIHKLISGNSIKGVIEVYGALGASGEEFKKSQIVNRRRGKGVQTRTITIRSKLRRQNPEFLALYAVCYNAGQHQMGRRGQCRDLMPNEKFKIGHEVIETIFLHKTVPTTNKIWFLLDTVEGYGKTGDVWPGPVHKSELGYQADARRKNTPQPRVTWASASNQKIKDFRFLESLRDLRLVAKHQPMTTPGSLRRERDKLVRLLHDQKSVYFSEFEFSRGQHGNVTVLFTFNKEKFIHMNSRFAKVFKNKEALLHCADIKEIELRRRRIRRDAPGNRLTPDYNPYNIEDVEKSYDTVAKLSGGGLQEANQSSGGTAVTYIAVDSGINMVDQATYEYEVYVEMQDDTTVALFDVVQDLKRKLRTYEEYLSFAEKGNGKNFDVGEYIQANPESYMAHSAKWEALIDSFLCNLLFIYGRTAFQRQSLMECKKNLLTLVNPRTCSATSLHGLRDMIHNYIGVVEGMVGPVGVGNSEARQDENSRVMATGGKLRQAQFVYIAPQKYVADSPPGVGLEYTGYPHGRHPVTVAGLKQIPFTTWETRIEDEKKKFPVAPDNVTNINSFGYLSPMAVRTPTATISAMPTNVSPVEVPVINSDTMEGFATPEDLSGGSPFGAAGAPTTQMLPAALVNIPLEGSLDLLQANMSADIKGPCFVGAPTTAHKSQMIKQDVMSMASISINSWTATLAETSGEPPVSDTTENPTDSSNYLGENSHFAINADLEEQSKSGSVEQATLVTQFQTATQQLTSPMTMNLLEAASNGFQTVKETNLGGIQGSLAGAALSGLTSPFAFNNSFARNVNFNSVKRVEVLETVRSEKGMQRWRQLTEGEFKELKKNAGGCVVRLSDTPNITNVPNAFATPSFDSLLYLGTATNFYKQVNRADATYDEYYVGLKATIPAKNLSVDISGPGSNLRPEYAVSSAMVYTARQAAPDVRKSEFKTPMALDEVPDNDTETISMNDQMRAVRSQARARTAVRANRTQARAAAPQSMRPAGSFGSGGEY